MPPSTQDAVVAAIRELHQDVARIAGLADSILGNVRGLYRRAKPGPVQPPIPGLVAPDDSKNDAPDGHVWTMLPAGEIARSLPRHWCNTVKVYEALWGVFHNFRFRSDDLFGETARDAIRKATDGRIKPQTVARMMTALRRAGVAVREGRNEWGLFPPTDERREAVERDSGREPASEDKRQWVGHEDEIKRKFGLL